MRGSQPFQALHQTMRMGVISRLCGIFREDGFSARPVPRIVCCEIQQGHNFIERTGRIFEIFRTINAGIYRYPDQLRMYLVYTFAYLDLISLPLSLSHDLNRSRVHTMKLSSLPAAVFALFSCLSHSTEAEVILKPNDLPVSSVHTARPSGQSKRKRTSFPAFWDFSTNICEIWMANRCLKQRVECPRTAH